MNRLSPVLPGCITAPVLKLDAPISFWGGVDQLTGLIIDRSHPQKDRLIGGQCLVVLTIRGSGGTPGNLAAMLKHDLGPAAIVLGYPDINVLTGISVAARLYDSTCPLFLASAKQLDLFQTGHQATINEDGSFSFDQVMPS